MHQVYALPHYSPYMLHEGANHPCRQYEGKGKGKGYVAVTQRIWACVSYDTTDVPIGHSVEWFDATQHTV